ncbi:CPBP family intramembrane glutamic endopeptidase [Staphylococcus coagulans]|uniref:CPBP family intramembrane metalloprotease n=1 Tax=Staphylococcus coagulans TaxID=74706 RepID=A0A9X0PI01_9STAP|nr:type II CAAX endopeptidase family protein [Staphylococcus coagulans]MBA8772138.1 CPBP family intramembrane metalloprotease [Staphylococcus coagulans]MBA8777704.1 CPBP family intramembrane metalloprotease [Staphylococcus coagulans]
MNSKIKTFFQDDFSVTKQPYVLSLIYALVVGAILYSGLIISDYVTQNSIYGVVSLAIVVLGIWLSKMLGFNLISFKSLNFRDFVYVFAGFIALRFLDTVFTFFQSDTGANDQATIDAFTGTPTWLLIISLAIVPAFVEEYIFRGFILRVVFRNHLLIGLIVSSILFTGAHSAGSFIEYIPYFYSALIFGLVYLHTKKIETSILIHFLNNVIFAIFLS